MLDTTNVSQKFHERVDLAIVVKVASVIADVHRDNGPVAVNLILVQTYIIYLREPVINLLPQLEEIILKFYLAVHHINIGFLLSVGLDVEENRVVEKLADWLVVVLEIEVSVNKCKAKHLGTQKGVNLALTLARNLTCGGATFE